MAKKIPGKEEFYETLRYYKKQLELLNVEVRLGQKVNAKELAEQDFSAIIIATGVIPRPLSIPGIDHPSVVSYIDVLKHNAHVGSTVAIIGAGGIGFDVATFLTANHSEEGDPVAFFEEWGVDTTFEIPGGIKLPAPKVSDRKIFLLQRSNSKLGKNLGKTTGWIHRATMKMQEVSMINNVSYQKVDDEGLHLEVGGEPKLLEVETIIICAGQLPKNSLEAGLKEQNQVTHVVGGAKEATGLDAQRAIKEGFIVANNI